MSLYRIFCSLHLIQLAVIVVGAPGRYISGEHLMPATKATVVALLLGLATSAALSASPTSDQAVFRDTYQQLVEINTTFSEGSCTRAAQAMAVRLRDAGMPERDIHVIVPPEWPTQGSLVAILHGSTTQLEPILLLAHIDVVEASREDWERDPFKLIEENGYFYARGVADNKAMAAIFVDALVRYTQTGYQPERTIKLALSCGEETASLFDGAKYLVEHHRELIDAGFALNEGGIGQLDSNGQRVYNGVQAGEKVYQNFRFEVTNPGGHSSRPVKDNAIYRLARALERVAQYDFPVEFNDTTRAYFEQMSAIKSGQPAADMLAILQQPPAADALARISANPGYNAILRTTCVATTIEGGGALNALPQRVVANVNCRIFPGHAQQEILEILEQVVEDPQVDISFVDVPETTSPPPPLTAEILGPIEAVTEQMWPGVPVLPTMAAGYTDGRILTPAGIPTYGVSGLFAQPGTLNAHGINEKLPVQSLYEGREFLDRLIRLYAGGS
jgi:acetylornithine deacetylase/succinyl-diaminopimelate desuccinylase-like protein